MSDNKERKSDVEKAPRRNPTNKVKLPKQYKAMAAMMKKEDRNPFKNLMVAVLKAG
jgi:hypothetical protein